MPRLQAIAVCQKVITSQEENLPTLFNVFDGFVVTVPQGRSIEEIQDQIVPFLWTVFTTWKREPDDQEKRFEYVLRLRLPDGQYVADRTAPLEFPPPRKVIRVSQVTEGFPARAGIYTVEVGFREVGAADWSIVRDYEIEIEVAQA